MRFEGKSKIALLAGLLLAPLLLSSAARADTIRILALGASNTNGKGLISSSQAWPAQLESMLRAKGYDVAVTVNALNGDTSEGILARAQTAISAGTRVVVFDTGGHNDRKRGISRAQRKADIAQIASVVRSHGAIPIRLDYVRIVSRSNSGNYQPDGIHLTAASHARVAAALARQVIAAIGKRK